MKLNIQMWFSMQGLLAALVTEGAKNHIFMFLNIVAESRLNREGKTFIPLSLSVPFTIFDIIST